MKIKYIITGIFTLFILSSCCQNESYFAKTSGITMKLRCKIVDTGTKDFYNDVAVILEPSNGKSFYGQNEKTAESDGKIEVISYRKKGRLLVI